MKNLRIWSFVVVVLLTLWGCDSVLEFGKQIDRQNTSPSGPANTPGQSETPAQQPNDQATNWQVENPQIIIGSFNIARFADKKASKPDVVSILVDVIRRFDVVAIQELQDKDASFIWDFLNVINSDGSRFAIAIGQPEGYRVNGRISNYYEQAAFIYDSQKLELLSTTYSAPNINNVMQRAPLVGHFRTTQVPAQNAFSFVLMNVHTTPRPSATRRMELAGIRDILFQVYQYHPQEDDFILVGDFNEEPDKFNHLGWMRSQFAAIPSSWKTNLKQTECYDNLVFDANLTSEFTGTSGVFDLRQSYQLTEAQTQDVSDHFPVWAVFDASEDRSQIATTQPNSEEVIR